MDVLQTIKERRSINFFEPGEAIPDDRIGELIALANLSPSSMNLQPWRVIAVRTPERKKVLRGIAFNQPKVEEASVVLIMIADPHALEENIDTVLSNWVELGYLKAESKENYHRAAMNLYEGPDSLRRKIFAVKNTGLFAMNIMIAAKGLGLETHPMDGFDEEKLKEEFHIPEYCVVPMIIAVGYLKKGITLLPRAFRRNTGDFTRLE
ncbi:MAG: nitroreductase family protein [Deltaproteobacteria bacterium]|nr:nitroreductase family protein [Deltaproteobacteria bacterium]